VRDPDWRVGHFERRIPAGYVQTLMSGRNVIADPRTHAYYDVIRTVTRAPLSAPGRLAAIVDLNLGRVEKPDMALYRDGVAP
jgi:arabinofuranosyltransferase